MIIYGLTDDMGTLQSITILWEPSTDYTCILPSHTFVWVQERSMPTM